MIGIPVVTVDTVEPAEPTPGRDTCACRASRTVPER
jgi:hypothetical protein